MRPRINKVQEPSVSLDSAIAILGITARELQLFCENDTECRYHHRSIFSNHVRFYPANIKVIQKLLDKHPIQVYANKNLPVGQCVPKSI